MKKTNIAGGIIVALVLTACSSNASVATPTASVASSATAVSGPPRLEGTWTIDYKLKKVAKGLVVPFWGMEAEMDFQPWCESGPCGGKVTVAQIRPKGAEPYTVDYRVDGETYTWESAAKDRPGCVFDGFPNHEVYYGKFSKVFRVTVSGDSQGTAASLTGTFSSKASDPGTYKGHKCPNPFIVNWALKGTPAQEETP
jgi:hypothetical protein